MNRSSLDMTLRIQSSGERLKITDDLPTLGLGELRFPGVGVDGAPRRHRCEGDAVRDPVLELARCVLRHVHLKVERPWVQGLRGGAVAETLRAMTHRAVRLIEGPTRRDGGGIVGCGVLRETGGQRYRWRRAPIPTRRSSGYDEAIRTGAFVPDCERDLPDAGIEPGDVELVPAGTERRGVLDGVERSL